MNPTFRNPRSRLIAELIFVALVASSVMIVLWPLATTFLSALALVAFAITVFVGMALKPLAHYGRAIGKRMPFDAILDVSV
jgi:hypothetical protein